MLKLGINKKCLWKERKDHIEEEKEDSEMSEKKGLRKRGMGDEEE